MRVLCSLLTVVLVGQVIETDDPPIGKEKWRADYADSTWGIKIKNVKYTTNTSPSQYRVILEFTKDLKTAEEVKSVKDGFEMGKDKTTKLEFHFFDEDGVVAYRCNTFTITGEVSGRKGDAFRATITLYAALEALAEGREAARVPESRDSASSKGIGW